MDAGMLTRSCEAEIVALHHFFTEWYRGTLPDTDAAWARVEGVLAPGFMMIAPDGRVFGREALLESVRAQHASRVPPEVFEIRIRDYAGRSVGEVVIATYEEWQRSADGDVGRQSTAVFEASASAPNGLRWLHVHETWLPTEA